MDSKVKEQEEKRGREGREGKKGGQKKINENWERSRINR